MQRYLYFILRLSNKLSVRAASFALFAVIAAFAAMFLSPLVPEAWASLLGTEAVDNILKIIASSMLVVVTFSLTTMVSAYASASQSVTPRAARILIEDKSSQTAISIFLGSFIFSIVSIFALATDYFDAQGRSILFLFTVVLLVVIVWTIIRWIETLSKLGRVHETIHRIENASKSAIKKMAKHPSFKCQEANKGRDPASGVAVHIDEQGYLQTIDFPSLQKIAEDQCLKVRINHAPGSFVHRSDPVVYLFDCEAPPDKDCLASLKQCFVTGTYRTFFEDGTLGFEILAEVASRSLSPAVNDPGTAVDVLTSVERLLVHWVDCSAHRDGDSQYSRLMIDAFDPCTMLQKAIYPISRDGAKNLEVVTKVLALLKSIEGCEKSPLSDCAKEMQKTVANRALESLVHEDEKAFLKSVID